MISYVPFNSIISTMIPKRICDIEYVHYYDGRHHNLHNPYFIRCAAHRFYINFYQSTSQHAHITEVTWLRQGNVKGLCPQMYAVLF